MEKIVINSSGKIIGKIEILLDKIIIKHNLKPELVINNLNDIKIIQEKTDEGILLLYDKYYLNIAEIAALYDVSYATLNKRFKKLPIQTGRNDKRRSTTYGKKLSEQTKRKIGEKSIGRHNSGKYERTSEIRQKISNGLKEYYSTHQISQQTKQKLSQAWVNGKYKNSPMGTGIHGYFTSIKNNKQFYFRSLLELKYLLIIEQDQTIKYYDVEPFSIKIEDNHHYTPDFLLNGQDIKELKPCDHLKYIKEQDRFNQQQQVAKQYAQKHNMTYEIIYDKDIDFESRKFKKYLLNNQQILKKYNISFDRDISKWS